MKYLILFCTFILGYFAYDALYSKGPDTIMSDEEISEVLESPSSESEELKRSLGEVMNQERSIASVTDDSERSYENVKLDPALEMQKLFNEDPEQAPLFVQQTLFDEGYDTQIRLSLFDEYIVREQDQVRLLNVSRNVLENSNDVEIFTRALHLQSQLVSTEELQGYLEQLMFRIQSPQFKEILMSYKASL